MERTVLWSAWHEPGLEHLRLVELPDGILADGLTIGLWQGQPFRVRYTLRCDTRWQVREALIERLDDDAALVLRAVGVGRWQTAAGKALPDLDGCVDIALSITPFTNTLAIRRLALAQGQAADVLVAHVAAPELRVSPAARRYTCLARHAAGARYHVEIPGGDYGADFSVDADGLVVDYAGAFQRVWSS